ncbi:MAG: prolyl oligopeptidase family serine peptidase, partial [Thermoleophilaceae bacterium]|nr:prolyl oligopeptidase family serine peptidase [Thermoleophilaceae bacterium]
PEGVKSEFPAYGGQLQPYLLTVPPGYDPAKPAGLTFSLHSLGGTYTQYAVFSPTQLTQFGDERQNLVVTTLGRGPDGWYTDEAEADFFEVWADLARHFRLDRDRVAISGYSMGGYGTYKLGLQWPDLFGQAFTTVGPPGRGVWIPPGVPSSGQFTNTNLIVENARWVPFLNWAGLTDTAVPYVGPRAQQARFDELGLRSQLWTYAGGHYEAAAVDQWAAARRELAAPVVQRDPRRVDYAFLPDADRSALGLVHDHAYWVSDLRVRDAAGDPATDPARGEISARSSAPTSGFAQAGRPVTKPVTAPNGESPAPQSVIGTEWERIRRLRPRNALRLNLENVGRATIDGRRAGLTGRRCLAVSIRSDGDSSVRLALPLPRGTRVWAGRRCGGAAQPTGQVSVGSRGASFRVRAGTHRYVLQR